MRRLGCLLTLGCLEPAAPIEIRGFVYDPESMLDGKPASVANAQIYLFDLPSSQGEIGDVTDEDGAFVLRDVPANFNLHPATALEPDYATTLDGLGTPLSSANVDNLYIPILSRGNLYQATSAWLGEDVSRLGAIVIAILDEIMPHGALVFEDVTVAVDGDACPIQRLGYGVRGETGHEIQEVNPTLGVPPPASFSGFVVVSAPAGCVVRATVADRSGLRDYLPHPMPIEPGLIMFIKQEPE